MASERAESPYRPGFSMPPAVLAGRDEILEDVDDAIATAALDNRMPTPIVLVGARGVGKTVLLEETAQRAGATYGWPWLRVEMTDSTPFTPTLLSGAAQIQSLITQDRPRDRFKASDATFRAGLPGVGAEVHVTRESAPVGEDPLDLRLGLLGLAEVASEHHTGVVITFDELQLVDRAEMGRLGAALQLGISQQWPFVVAFAGLDAVRQPGLLPTYFERANWHTLDVLDEQSAARALAGPAEAAGRPFDPMPSPHSRERPAATRSRSSSTVTMPGGHRRASPRSTSPPLSTPPRREIFGWRRTSTRNGGARPPHANGTT